MNVSVIYWSGTGNTQAMAELIAQAARSAGAAVDLQFVSDASVDSFERADVVALGCPSMGVETLEDSEFEPFLEDILSKAAGKPVALFGSYGWGDGQWMRDWEARMQEAGAVLIGEGLTVNDAPAGADEARCRQLGASLAEG